MFIRGISNTKSDKGTPYTMGESRKVASTVPTCHHNLQNPSEQYSTAHTHKPVRYNYPHADFKNIAVLLHAAKPTLSFFLPRYSVMTLQISHSALLPGTDLRLFT